MAPPMFPPVDRQTLRLRVRPRATEWGRVLVFFAASACTPCAAQTASPEPASSSTPAAAEVQRVEVDGGGNNLQRKNASAAKVIVSHEDLVRYDDSNLADALQRIPGVSVQRTTGKDAEIRLRGLGNGYTQILVDGSPVGPGFNIDSLSPDLIDHVEILRSATAEMSAQSIAGSINVILKKKAKTVETTVKLSVGGYDDVTSESAIGDHSDRDGIRSWGVGASVRMNRDRLPSISAIQDRDASGAVTSDYLTPITETTRTWTAEITPHAQWDFSDSNVLNITGLAEQKYQVDGSSERRDPLAGVPPDFITDSLGSTVNSSRGEFQGEWKRRIGSDGRLVAKLALEYDHRDSSAHLDAQGATGVPLLHRAISSSLSNWAPTMSSKLSYDIGNDHTFTFGWDGDYTRRSEDRIQTETSDVGYPTLDLHDDYRATVWRVAAFAQDEWTFSPSLSGYAGLRWETLRTRTVGAGFVAVSRQSVNVSPTAQLLWKIPGTKSDQLRISIARTYKAPTPRDLIPRQWIGSENSPTQPNFLGSPTLLPELAWGLDAGYERYLAGDAFLGANLFVRRISNVILDHVYEQNGTWLETPQNSGNADVAGIELEARGNLRQLSSGAPDIDLRLGNSIYMSRLDAVPGPHNRLDRQPARSASAGADWRIRGLPLTTGLDLVWERGGEVRTSAAQWSITSGKRQLDLYGLWQASKAANVRLSVSNLLHPGQRIFSGYQDATFYETQDTRNQDFIGVKLQLDLTL